MPQNKRWWMSWWEPVKSDLDSRPLKWPLPKSIPAWGQSGFRDDAASNCAVVDAPIEKAAKAKIEKHWKPSEWRFCEEKPNDWKPSERFPWPKE